MRDYGVVYFYFSTVAFKKGEVKEFWSDSGTLVLLWHCLCRNSDFSGNNLDLCLL